MKKRILVTGGAGYIGIFVVNELLAKGYAVQVLDKLIYGDAGLKAINKQGDFSFTQGDICDEQVVEEAVRDADAVIALAAIVGDPACNINRDLTMKVNYHANQLLLRKCREAGVERLVFSSSCSVYGRNNGQTSLTEQSALEPVSLYAETRILSERLFLQDPELCTVVLRFSTIFGLGPRMRFDLAVNLLSGRAAKGEPVEISGGNQWRPFLHAADAAHACVLALEAPREKVKHQIFNVGSNNANYQLSQIGQLISSTIPGSLVRQSTTVDDQRNYYVSFDKIRDVLGFDITRTVPESMIEIAEYVKSNHIDIYEDKYHNVKIWQTINRTRFLPFALPDVDEKERAEVMHTIDSGWLSTGPKAKKFENALVDYFETEGLHCIPVSSCTAGLHLQLAAHDIGPGEEVITTPLTFCATVHTIMQTGAKPVLVDIDRSTYNIDLKAIEDKITPRTRAIVPVYYGGNPFDYDRLARLANRHGLLLLVDAAHGMGGRYKERKLGTFEDSAAFSFYATKNMTTGEGGLVTTRDAAVANRIRKMLSFGMDKDAWRRYSDSGNWYYEISDIGFKYNFTDIQAAFGLHQLKKIDAFNRQRNELCALYDAAFAECDELIVPTTYPEGLSTRHLYPLLIRPERLKIDRNQFINLLKEANIGTSVHYVPIHHHSYFQKTLGCVPGDYPHTDWFFEREISMPVYTKLDEQDIQRIIDTVKKILRVFAIPPRRSVHRPLPSAKSRQKIGERVHA